MNDPDPRPVHYQDLRTVSGLLHSGALSPVALTEHTLRRIEALDGSLHSYAFVSRDNALAAAERAEAELSTGRSRGPLHGVPVAVKDLYGTSDAPTAFGTKLLEHHFTGADATTVQRLRDAGAVLIGKLRMSEAALADHNPAFPTPINPWSADTWTGTSSSGCGTATAAGMCFASLGSDTGGSIRFPATAAGLTAIKPTWGRVSRAGALELAGSLDHLGTFARSVWDNAAVLGVIAGADPADLSSSSVPVPDYLALLDQDLPARLRLGVAPSFSADFDTVTRQMLAQTASAFESLGVELVEIELPDVMPIVNDWVALVGVQAAVAMEDLLRPELRGEYGDEIAGVLDVGRSLSGTEYQRILLRRQRFSGEIQRCFTTIDALLMPTIGIASPTVAQINEIGTDSSFWWSHVMKSTCPFNFSQNPAVVFPTGLSDRGTPLGAQLIGPHFGEALLLQLAHAFQQVTEYHLLHPMNYA